MDFSKVWNSPPFGLEMEEKNQQMIECLSELTSYHIEHCPPYRCILEAYGMLQEKYYDMTQIPFIPVRLFKELKLVSVPENKVFKTMTSSGTSGQSASKIVLDKETAADQQKAMLKIVSDFTGAGRMPMLVIDCPGVIKDRRMFSARGAGILGFSIFGKDITYALNDDMSLNKQEMCRFLEKHQQEKILLFGFTFMVWQHFYKELQKDSRKYDFSNAVLIHGGGWKKLQSESVSNECFCQSLKEVCGISRVHDYYGMAEQTGSIYMQCECGHLHASIFSDVIFRRGYGLEPCAAGERGVLQTVSVLPESYPGHSILTEDEGMLLGMDDCPCGRKGKYFKIFGRLKNAEIRGCSDTYAVRF